MRQKTKRVLLLQKNDQKPKNKKFVLLFKKETEKIGLAYTAYFDPEGEFSIFDYVNDEVGMSGGHDKMYVSTGDQQFIDKVLFESKK